MSRISAVLDSVTTSASDKSVSITAQGHFKYASGTWGYTVDGYLSINGSKKNFDNARGTTSGGTFGSISYTHSVSRAKTAKTVTVKLYGYCDESTSDTATATKSITVNALPHYTVKCDGVSYTKWIDETLTLPQPTKAGYTFGGWTDGTTTYKTSYKKNAAATLTSVWIANTVAPKVNAYSAIRQDNNKTAVNVRLSYTAGLNADGTTTPVTRLKLEVAASGGEYSTAFDVANPPQPFTGTLTNIAETNAYSLRWTLYDANYPNGVTVYDTITKTAYIWRATGEGLDFGVPVTIGGLEVLTGSAEAGAIRIGSLLLQWGSVSINPSSGASGSGTIGSPYYKSATVTFPKAFSKAPHVMVSIGGTWTGTNICSAGSATATTFTARLYCASKSDADRTIRWLAIGTA